MIRLKRKRRLKPAATFDLRHSTFDLKANIHYSLRSIGYEPEANTPLFQYSILGAAHLVSKAN